MEKYLKMADVFGGQVTHDHDRNYLTMGCNNVADFGFSSNLATYAAHAINTHDELVAEVERLRRQLACAFMAGWEEGINGMECDEAEVASIEIAEQFARN